MLTMWHNVKQFLATGQKVATWEFERYMDMENMQGDKKAPMILSEKQICIQDARHVAQRNSQMVYGIKGRK